ncbi:MAG: helix-turn-helix domain-containing protein [Bdellovibrio sp.]|nr:helix-turn-helix domain-containing protein [Bdellovibrio sp.]
MCNYLTKYFKIIKQSRQELGITQFELAIRTGVSLPTIQNIELGRANPTLEVLEKLSGVLDLKIEFKRIPLDWDLFASYGVGLTTQRKETKLLQKPLSNYLADHTSTLLKLIYKALYEMSTTPAVLDAERKKEALQGLLLAIKTHYPSFYKKHLVKSKAANNLISCKNLVGKVLKLRRYSLAIISGYL